MGGSRVPGGRFARPRRSPGRDLPDYRNPLRDISKRHLLKRRTWQRPSLNSIKSQPDVGGELAELVIVHIVEAFAARLSGLGQTTGLPSMANRLHLYICAFPDWEYVKAHVATKPHSQRTTPLNGYRATGLHAAARPNGGRVAHGRPRAMLPILREVPSAPPESSLHLQALFRNRAALPKIHA